MDLIYFYKKCLSELLLVEHPTSLMKKVINTIKSREEHIYMYDVTKQYASLFLSDEMCTIYLYPDLTCSLLKPPQNQTIPHWSKYIINTNHVTKPTPIIIDINLLYDILEQDPDEKEKKDNEMLEYFIKDTPCFCESINDSLYDTKDPIKDIKDIYEPIKDIYEPVHDLYEPISKSKDLYKSDSPDYGPDFGPDLGKELDFTLGDELSIKPVEKGTIKESTKKLKTVVKKIIKQRPLWK